MHLGKQKQGVVGGGGGWLSKIGGALLGKVDPGLMNPLFC